MCFKIKRSFQLGSAHREEGAAFSPSCPCSYQPFGSSRGLCGAAGAERGAARACRQGGRSQEPRPELGLLLPQRSGARRSEERSQEAAPEYKQQGALRGPALRPARSSSARLTGFLIGLNMVLCGCRKAPLISSNPLTYSGWVK